MKLSIPENYTLPEDAEEDEAVAEMEDEDMEAVGPMSGMGERIMGMA